MPLYPKRNNTNSPVETQEITSAGDLESEDDPGSPELALVPSSVMNAMPVPAAPTVQPAGNAARKLRVARRVAAIVEVKLKHRRMMSRH